MVQIMDHFSKCFILILSWLRIIHPQPVYPQDLITPRIDHLYDDPAVVARRKGRGDRAGELCEGLLVQCPGQAFAQLLPGVPVREEGLADAEAAAVIVAVEQ